jgi:hypothetical protein
LHKISFLRLCNTVIGCIFQGSKNSERCN